MGLNLSGPHLVIGISGQVGGALGAALQKNGAGCRGTYCGHPVSGAEALDVRDPGAVGRAVRRIGPSVVYLPASMTNVDGCEEDPAGSSEVNVAGVQNVVGAAKEAGAKLVYFSSDYVFDGESGPYREEDRPNPISEYGRQKLEAEDLILSRLDGALIVRTTWVYGWEAQGKNFIVRLLGNLRAGRTARVPQDQIGTPVYAPNLAEAVVELALSGAAGIWHVAGTGLLSRFEFAREAARVFGLDPGSVVGVSTEALGQKAKRPLRGGLVTEKARARLKTRLMNHREGLKAMRAAEIGDGCGKN